jgi:uroporphyrinogen decarboxylase
MTMTSRERLLTVIRGDLPDCVPVAPDFSNMIPARLTGKPFWDLYLYNDPPIWEAYIACAKHFNVDSLMDAYFPFWWPSYDEDKDSRPWETFIVQRDAERIVTQASYQENGRRIWGDRVNFYPVADPPTFGLDPAKIGLPAIPVRYEPLTGVKPVDLGVAGLRRVKELMGNQGLVGIGFATTNLCGTEEAVYRFTDHPEELEQVKAHHLHQLERKFEALMAMRREDWPDFLCVGGSGTMVLQSPAFFREHALPIVKRAIELATSVGMPTHVHSCGPETELVKIMAEETSLTVIDPLEIPPMGDCNLAELKRKYGRKLVLKGNLHTTEVMLRGTPDDVRRASRQAIDDGAAGGRFILSTGDQCGRDTPDANLYAMIETARTYGRYPLHN